MTILEKLTDTNLPRQFGIGAIKHYKRQLNEICDPKNNELNLLEIYFNNDDRLDDSKMKVYIFKSGNLYLRIDIYNWGTLEIPKVYEITEQDYIKSDETNICKYVKVDIGWNNVIDDHIKYFKVVCNSNENNEGKIAFKILDFDNWEYIDSISKPKKLI